MSGRLVGSTPWGRQGIARMDPSDIAAIEEAIPDGHTISVGAALKPGDWTLSLRDDAPHPVAQVYHQRTIEGGCVALLQLAEVAA